MAPVHNRIVAAFAALLALAVLAAATPSQADTGRVRLVVTKAGFIVGAQGGQGTLTFRGKSYPLSVGGISAGFTFGGSQANLVGRAYNLRRVSDIEGTYAQGTAGAAAGAGAKVVQLTNEKGVTLALSGPQIGLEVALDLSGLSLRLAR